MKISIYDTYDGFYINNTFISQEEPMGEQVYAALKNLGLDVEFSEDEYDSELSYGEGEDE